MNTVESAYQYQIVRKERDQALDKVTQIKKELDQANATIAHLKAKLANVESHRDSLLRDEMLLVQRNIEISKLRAKLEEKDKVIHCLEIHITATTAELREKLADAEAQVDASNEWFDAALKANDQLAELRAAVPEDVQLALSEYATAVGDSANCRASAMDKLYDIRDSAENKLLTLIGALITRSREETKWHELVHDLQACVTTFDTFCSEAPKEGSYTQRIEEIEKEFHANLDVLFARVRKLNPQEKET